MALPSRRTRRNRDLPPPQDCSHHVSPMLQAQAVAQCCIMVLVARWRPDTVAWRLMNGNSSVSSKPYAIGGHTCGSEVSFGSALGNNTPTPMGEQIDGVPFHMEYKPGRTNVVADALSRRGSEPGELLALSGPTFTILDDLRQAASTDPALTSLAEQACWHIGRALVPS
ncbi:hypothetical protein U9M48_019428 [Paspalum notatum var. saurae]|uniref:Uncharacterized protein n=1 Tax=Paspalum notatum var. saurae TaxID=547442 RepID=A0AAQ3TCB0_PASNO